MGGRRELPTDAELRSTGTRQFAIGLSGKVESTETDILVTLGEPESAGAGLARIERIDACVDDSELKYEVAAGEPFVRWANQHRTNPDWAPVLELLLQLLSGPWVHGLEIDDGSRPLDTIPSCLEVPEWLVDLVLTAAYHGLSTGRPGWILSYGSRPYLDHAAYRVERAERRIELQNLRADRDAAEAEAALSRADVETTLAVLEEAALHAPRVRVLDSARSSAKRWELDCAPAALFEDPWPRRLCACPGRRDAPGIGR